MSTRADDVRGGGHGVQGRGAQITGARVQVGESTPGRRDNSEHREAVREYELAKDIAVDALRKMGDASHARAQAQRDVESHPCRETFLRLRAAEFEDRIARVRHEAATAWCNEAVARKAATERR